MSGTRIAKRFQALKQQGRAGLVTFITAGDPDHQTSLSVLQALPQAGADIIELGMPFTDPMADGPAIQAAALRALKAGASMDKTLDLVRAFRQNDHDTPIVLMGYYNPIYAYGPEAFAKAAHEAGVDGVIVVDLPPEEADELTIFTKDHGLDFIVLATPTTDAERLKVVLARASGFVYYVSVLGITGTVSANQSAVAQAVERLKAATDLPIAVGFGVKTPEQAKEIGKNADAVVVGSALVQKIADGIGQTDLKENVVGFVQDLAAALRR